MAASLVLGAAGSEHPSNARRGGRHASGRGYRSHDIEIETVFELGVVHLAKALWRKLGIEAAIASRIAE